MKADDFKRALKKIVEDENAIMIHVSPDFQCDQSGGFPVSLCVCWELEKAWLAPNKFFMADTADLSSAWQCCAGFGIRRCTSTEDYNTILKALGPDAYESAYLPPEDQEESPGLQI